MAGEPILRKAVLAKAGAKGPWAPGTICVYADHITFAPRTRREVDVATHLTWPNVYAVGCSMRGAFWRVQLAHNRGVETYRCFGARRFARALAAVRARPPASNTASEASSRSRSPVTLVA